MGIVGTQKFLNTGALKGRVKEILNSRSDGEALKTDGSDFKLIKALLDFHPKGEEKRKGMVGIKVGKSVDHGDSRCFHMVKEDGKVEDFSAQKCLSAIEANPPYVEVDTKKEGIAPKPENSEAPKVTEKKEESAETPAEEKKEEEKKD